MNILITGAKGQLGSELQLLYSLYPQYTFFPTDVDTLDLTKAEKVKDYVAENRIDYIINCAAYTAVDKAEDDEALCWLINRDAVANLAEAAKGKAHIIHISTDYVFDGKASKPYRESDAVNPQSVYGRSKLAGEEALTAICAESMIIRTAWLYSSFGNNFVKTMLRLGSERDEINVVADQTGTPTYAGDLAQAILHIIYKVENGETFAPGIYHYSNEGVTSWYDFTRKIFELSDTQCRVNPITTAQYPTRAVRPQYSVLDKTKIKTRYDVEVPQWEESLAALIAQLKN